MDKKQAEELIYAGLGNTLKGTGMRLVKSQGAFVRTIPQGRQNIAVPLYDYTPEFAFSLSIGIRMDAVEDIFNLFSGATGKYQRLTLTTITPLDFFTGAEHAERRVRAPDDVERAVRELSAVIELDIVPFLCTYMTVEAVDQALHVDPRPRFDITEASSKAMHGVVVARLAGNPLYPDIVVGYRELLTAASQAVRQRFEDLVAHLDTLT
jgi:hypothetical protein